MPPNMRTRRFTMYIASGSLSETQLHGQARHVEIRMVGPMRRRMNAWDSVIGCFDALADDTLYCMGDIVEACRSAKDSRQRSYELCPQMSLIQKISSLHNRLRGEGRPTQQEACSRHDEVQGAMLPRSSARSIGGICMTPFDWIQIELLGRLRVPRSEEKQISAQFRWRSSSAI